MPYKIKPVPQNNHNIDKIIISLIRNKQTKIGIIKSENIKRSFRKEKY